MLNTLLDTLAKAPDAPTFDAPDHAMLEQMLAGIEAPSLRRTFRTGVGVDIHAPGIEQAEERLEPWSR